MEDFLGTIQAFAFGFPPRGWAFCDGQLMSIAQNTALFSLLGTVYGGDGIQTFGLPDLRGRSIVHPGTGPGLSTIVQGEAGGIESTTLLITNMPMHNHVLVQGTNPGQVNLSTVIRTTENGSATNESDNGNNSLGTGGNYPNVYSEPPLGTSNSLGGVASTISGSTSIAGGSQPFDIRNPYLGVYMSICLEGIFPSRN